MLPQLQAAGVNVMVVTVASPTKAAEFVDAQAQLPLENVYCSADLDAYRALGFYDNFGAALGARNAAFLPLQKIRERGQDGLKDMADSNKNYAKVSPVGLVSGKPFAIEDAKAATQLGGAFALDGGKVVFAHRDRAVADHVDLAAAAAALGVA
mmetsp:Transcript_20479/g.39750  ORF Transcript_20479/g.39750 Transcript_20479/m.39750 type:complete len:153 (+) Transcript_20479:442-900(+)